MIWDGKDRRRLPDSDHDLLTRIDQNLQNLVDQYEKHVSDDKDSFEKLYAKTSLLQKYIWLALGGLGVIGVLFKIK